MLSKIYNKCFSIIELICERLVCLISHIESSSYCGKVMMYHEDGKLQFCKIRL